MAHLLSAADEQAVREGFARVAHVDGYGYRRARSLSEKAFTEDFLGEVAPQLSRRLATALWQALSHDRWSIDEERFVEALAIARCGRDEDKLRLAMLVAARATPPRDDGRRGYYGGSGGVYCTPRAVVALLRAVREDALGAGLDDESESDDEGLYGPPRPDSAPRGVSGERAHLRTADLVDAVGLATSRDEIRVAALLRPSREPVRRDDDDESDGLGDSDADFTERLDGRRNLARRRERSEAHELLLASVRDQLCAFVVAALDGWAPGALPEAPPEPPGDGAPAATPPRPPAEGAEDPGAYSAAPSSATRPSPDGAPRTPPRRPAPPAPDDAYAALHRSSAALGLPATPRPARDDLLRSPPELPGGFRLDGDDRGLGSPPPRRRRRASSEAERPLDGELAAALFGKLQEHSSSGAVDLATVVDCFSGERLRDRPRLEAPVRGVWVSTLHCRRLFAVLDANRSGVAHREAFEAVFRCCCGPVTRSSEAREADLCARVGVRAGVLRACVEDALYVRLGVARPADGAAELRVVSPYVSLTLSAETCVPGDTWVVLPKGWLVGWNRWAEERAARDAGVDGAAQAGAPGPPDCASPRPAPIDASYLLRARDVCSQPRDDVVLCDQDGRQDDGGAGALLRALRRDVAYDEDFVFVPPQLYLALRRWHGERGAPVARRVAVDERGRPSFEAHAARCLARRAADRAVVVPVLRHEPVHVVAARAHRALELHAGRGPLLRSGSPPRRLRVRAVRRDAAPEPRQPPSEAATVVGEPRLQPLYDGPPFSAMYGGSRGRHADAWTRPCSCLMDASQPGDGDEAPVDVTIELLFDDGGDEPEDGGETHTEVAAPARPVGGLRPDLDGDARVGEVGLRNLGNTCYMNSVLQALAHVPPLRAYFASGEFRYDINTRSKFGARGALATAFGELLGELDESEEAVTPDTFKRTLGDWNDTFAGFGQQDASEFLQQLLEGLGEDLNRVEDKPYVENPDVAGDAESPFPADPRVQVDVAAECWRNHADLREDHPVTALFGGQTRRELVCDANDVEKSVGFDAFSSLAVPLFDADSAARGEETVRVRVRLRFARQRCWPVDAVVPVPADAAVGDVLEAAAALPLSSRTLEHAPTLENFDDEPELAAFGGDASNLVAMLPCLGPRPSATERALDAAAHLLSPRAGLREPALAAVFATHCTHRLDIYEVPPLVDAARPIPPAALCTVALRTLDVAERYFSDPSRLRFFGDPFVIRIVEHETTGADLYRVVWEQLAPFCDSVPRDGSGPPFALRAFASRGSDRERLAAGTLAGSEMLLPDGGRLVPDDGRVLCDDARCLEGVRFAADVPTSLRRRFNDRALRHALVHTSCAPAPPPPPIALEACLAAVGAPETVTKYSAAETRRNGGEYAEAAHTSRVSLWRAPPVLALVLKRFFVTERGRRRKLSDRVAFPVDGLELSTFLDGARDGPGPSYDLVAVVNHFGGLEHGHYTCAARRLDGRGWLEFDDRRVEALEIGDVCDDPAAYVLFYARRDVREAARPLDFVRERFARVRDEPLAPENDDRGLDDRALEPPASPASPARGASDDELGEIEDGRVEAVARRDGDATMDGDGGETFGDGDAAMASLGVAGLDDDPEDDDFAAAFDGA